MIRLEHRIERIDADRDHRMRTNVQTNLTAFYQKTSTGIFLVEKSV
ncbi:hypothetical protein LEP1GSC047_0132 [Leptospira inadai serovar Lyme str. 10]|uniref:Uncharacterized protein n=1 Tax=Leptospira inadai serovar Lyme str. 10 TaxID=1049790 RepID=V6HF44_9LEPT|nr:hypothetical protein LEP1GSC047_0132 [Leptospira inadai serovar Lyme str. 10]